MAHHRQAVDGIDATHHLRRSRHEFSRQIFVAVSANDFEGGPRRCDVWPRARAADGRRAKEAAGPGGEREVLE